MSRWIARFIGILMILVFFLLLAHLQRRLIELQNHSRRPAATRSR